MVPGGRVERRGVADRVFPVGHPGVCRCRAGSGLRGSGGGEEGVPFGGGEGEVSIGGVLGVPDRRAAGEFGDLDAVLAVTAVAALLEYELVVHHSLSRDLRTSAMNLAD